MHCLPSRVEHIARCIPTDVGSPHPATPLRWRGETRAPGPRSLDKVEAERAYLGVCPNRKSRSDADGRSARRRRHEAAARSRRRARHDGDEPRPRLSRDRRFRARGLMHAQRLGPARSRPGIRRPAAVRRPDRSARRAQARRRGDLQPIPSITRRWRSKRSRRARMSFAKSRSPTRSKPPSGSLRRRARRTRRCSSAISCAFIPRGRALSRSAARSASRSSCA